MTAMTAMTAMAAMTAMTAMTVSQTTVARYLVRFARGVRPPLDRAVPRRHRRTGLAVGPVGGQARRPATVISAGFERDALVDKIHSRGLSEW